MKKTSVILMLIVCITFSMGLSASSDLTSARPATENVSISLNVQFDTGKAIIKPSYHCFDLGKSAGLDSKTGLLEE